MNINTINGVGDKTEKILNKLGIYTTNDLINYYPYRYVIYSFNKDLPDTNEVIITNAIIESNPMIAFIKKNFNRLSFRANINGKIINVTIFNRAFMKKNLTIGKEIVLVGKYNISKNIFTASDIKFNIQNGDVESVYHLTNGISNNIISKLVKESLKKDDIKDYLPLYLKEKYNFKDKNYYINLAHFPKNEQDIKIARERLIYDELFDFSFKMNFLAIKNKKENGIERNINFEEITKFINSLPFKLTEDQNTSVKEIYDDLNSKKRMNRLILGDVGSGKTIIATLAIYMNFLSGYQSVLMAPTEILAIQHYYSIKRLLQPFNVHVDIITGSMSKKEKKSVYDALNSGEINLLIGTHAVLSDELTFKKLGLVITDEQHRFGVNQRGVLQNKGNNPDVLYLSATPIPRTYAMTIYGDLDISLIKTKPSGRKEIITKVKKENEIKDVLLSMYEELKKNHQIYIVSPLVEDNDSDLTSVNSLKENMEKAFNGKVRCEIIHGKMKQSVKDAIMNNFKENQTKILISTTVIEVGIDVKNATMMVIFNAERFGLATLHQLRGRVGRNDEECKCFLISNFENERLKVMEQSNDGFYISEQDFKQRGHGDLFGTRQHGDMHFKIANIQTNYDILLKAKDDSKEYISSKEYLNNSYYKSISDELNITD